MIRIGILGLGAAAQETYIPALERLDDNKIVAVCDIDPTRAHRTAERLQTRAYTEPVKMVEQQCPDGLLVLTPPFVHLDGVMLGLDTDCHVFCEMPPALNRNEIEQMIDRAREKEVNLVFSFHHRYSPAFQQMKELADQVTSGVLCLTYAANLEEPSAESIRTFGHPLLRPAIRLVDMALWLQGPAREIRHERSCNRVATIEVEHVRGAHSFIHLNLQSMQSLERHLLISEGLTAALTFKPQAQLQIATAETSVNQTGGNILEFNGALGQVAAFLKCSDKGKSAPHPPEDALTAADIAWKMLGDDMRS